MIRKESIIDASETSKRDRKPDRHLFLLSFGDRDPLAATIAAAGWRVSSARRDDNVIGRFLASNALIAVIDVRSDTDRAVKAIREISGVLENGEIAILVLTDGAAGSGMLSACYDAGATHFLDMSVPGADLEQAIKFAFRYVEAVKGGSDATRDLTRLLAESDEEWWFAKSDLSENHVSVALRKAYPTIEFDRYPVTGIYRILGAEERRRVRGAVGRLRDGSAQAAVVHQLGADKVIHHVHDDGERIIGRIERSGQDTGPRKWMGREALSGLKNATYARSWIDEHLKRGEQVALWAFGLRNIAVINSAHGRIVGDEILRQVGLRLIEKVEEIFTEESVIARMDGQNFTIASSGLLSGAQCQQRAEQLVESLSRPITLDGRVFRMIPRVGVAVGSGELEGAVLLRRTVLALAQAMSSDAVPIKFSDASDQNIVVEQRLENDLAQAIENGEIAISFQPQIKVATGQLIGAEALARWNHPEFGLLGAATLFGVAERSGLLLPLSAHIHQRALAEAAAWPDSLSFLRVSINVTAGDLANREFATQLLSVTQDSGFTPDRTTLEITESELIGDLEGAAEHLGELRSNAFRIAIDDFGTGYSSLSYLKNLPLDYLKIDSGLTSDIRGSEKDQIVVKSIIDMARNLGLAVIAEGVETEAQLEMLAAQKCEYYQGFLRSGPLSPEEFEIFALKSN